MSLNLVCFKKKENLKQTKLRLIMCHINKLDYSSLVHCFNYVSLGAYKEQAALFCIICSYRVFKGH